MDEWQKPIDSGKIPDSNSHFDVIVVGGGPGGSAGPGESHGGGRVAGGDRYS